MDPATRRAMERLTAAHREHDRLVPLIFERDVTTREGLCAMAKVLGTLYENGRGVRSFAVRSLVGNLLKVLGEQKVEDRA